MSTTGENDTNNLNNGNPPPPTPPQTPAAPANQNALNSETITVNFQPFLDPSLQNLQGQNVPAQSSQPAVTLPRNAQQFQQAERPEVNFFAKIPMQRLQNNDVEAWFYSLEFWFPASGITTDMKKFNTVLASLDSSVLFQLAPVINAAPQQNRYEYIKRKLIEYFSESNQRRLNRLLSELPLGDLRPSQLFHEMRRVAGSTMSDEAVKGLWAQRLPEHARAAAVASNGTMEEITRIADAVVDALQMRTINVTSATPLQVPAPSTSSQSEIDQLKLELNRISKNMEKLLSNSQRSRSRTRSKSRDHQSRSNTPSSNACWYHRKFGIESKKCRSPCRYKKPAPADSSSSNE